MENTSKGHAEYMLKTLVPLGAEMPVEVTHGQTVDEVYVSYKGKHVLVAVREQGCNGDSTRFGIVIGYVRSDTYVREDYFHVLCEPVAEAEYAELSDIVRQALTEDMPLCFSR